jgi:hypothetical protein
MHNCVDLENISMPKRIRPPGKSDPGGSFLAFHYAQKLGFKIIM